MAQQKLTTGGSLCGAYGRKYTTHAQIIKDFEDGKDFFMTSPYGSGYCSIRDFAPGVYLQFRYGKKNEHVVEYTTK